MSKSKARKLAEFLRNLNDNSKLDTTGFADNRFVTSRSSLETNKTSDNTFVTNKAVTEYVDNAIEDFVVDTTDFTLTFDGHMTGTATVTDFGDTTISLAAHSSLGTDDITEHADYPYFTNARARSAISVSGSTLSYDSSTGVITSTANNYVLPTATSSALGGVKIGYSENGKNYPVELSNGQMYVNVPWVDTNTTYSVGDGGLTQKNFTTTLKDKLDGIAANANNYVLPFTDNSSNWNTAYGWGNHASQGYATLANPALTGTPTAPTAAAGTNTTQIATTAFVETSVSNLVDSAPGTLNTLNELAAALGDDANFSTTVTNSIATKLPLAGGTITGAGTTALKITNTSGNGGYFNVNSNVGGVSTDGNVGLHIGWNKSNGGREINMIFDGGTSQADTEMIFTSTDGSTYTDIFQINGATSGSTAGVDIKTGGLMIGGTRKDQNWDTAYGWGNHASAGYLTSFDITTQTDSKYLRSDTSDTWNSLLTYNGSNNGLEVGGIRGTALGSQTGDFIHLYERVNIGYPSGWGASGAAAPSYGLSTWGGAQINIGNVSNAPFTFNGNNVWHAGNDGSGSGLDADLLDGQHASSFLRLDSSSATPQVVPANRIKRFKSQAAINTTSGNQSSLEVYGNNGAGTDAFMTFHVENDYALYFGLDGETNDLAVGGWSKGANSYKVWHAGNDGTGSGLDADLLDGQHGSYYQNASNINAGTLADARLGGTVFRSRGSVNVTTSSGGSNSNPFDDAHTETRVAEYGARLISYTGASATMLSINTGGSASVFQIGAHYNGNDFYMRTRTDSSNWQTWKKLWHTGNDGSGSGLDADTVDGIHGSQFLRSDAGDTATGSIIFSGATQYFRKNNATNYTNGSLMVESYGGSSSIAAMGFHISGSIGRMLSMNNTGLLSWEDDLYTAGYVQSNSSMTAATTVTANQGFVVPNTSQYGLRSNNGNNYFLPLDSYNNMHIRSTTGSEYHDSTAYYFRKVDQSNIVTITASNTNIALGSLTRASNTVWDAGNDGSGSGLDADLLDGINSSSFLRSDQSDSMSGELNVNRNGGVTGTSAPQYSDVNIELQTSSNHVPGISFHRGGYSATTLYEYDGELYVNAWTARNQTGKLVSFGNDGSGSGLDADLLDGLHGSSYWQKSGSWYGDLGSNGYDRVQGIAYTGGEFVLVEKNAQISTLVDGDYFAYEAGGFFSSSNSAYGTLSGFKAYNTDTIQVQQKDGGNANLRVTGSITRAGNTVWDSGNDGASSGLDADLIDGMHRYNHHGVGEKQTITVNGDTDKYYPVVISGGSEINSEFEIYRGYNEQGPDDWNSATHKGGLTFRYRITGSAGWGGYPTRIHVYEAGEIYSTVLGGLAYTAHTMKHVVWLRGGGTTGARYHIFSPTDFSVVIYDDTSSGYTSGSGWLSYDHSNASYDTYVNYRTLAQRNAAMEGEIYNNMSVSYNNAQTHTSLSGTGPAKTFWHTSNDGSGSGLDADTLDGINSGSFLRSDAADTASGALIFTGSIRSMGHSSGDNWLPYTDGNFYIRAPNTYFDANVEFNDEARVVTGSITTSNSTKGLMFDGNYETGQYRHRFRKQDLGAGIPLFIDYAHSSANSYSTVASFGGPGSNYNEFTVYGDQDVQGQLIINNNIASPANYYNGLQMEVRATSGTAGIGLHRNGYSHVGIYTNAINRLDFDFNSGDVIMNHNAGTLWGSGNDGSGSGLDADTVDGIQGSSILQTSTGFGGDVSGTYNAIVVANNSHQHSQLYENSTITYGASQLQWLDNNGTGGTGLNGSSPANVFSDWHHHLVMNHANSGGYYTNLQCSFHSDRIHYRRLTNGSLSTGVELFHTGNDGSGSGLDADLLDGQHGSYYTMPPSNITTNGNMNNVSGPAGHYASVQFYNMYTPSGSGNQANYNVPEDGGSHYHVQQFNGYSNSYNNWKYQIAHSFYNGRMYHRNQYDTTWQGWATVWDSDSDGSGSGLDADLLDGLNSTSFVRLDANNTYSTNTVNYFRVERGGYCGSINTANLQAYTTGANSAFMSFHRSGSYAVNMGLDADNVLRIGGWSASANRWVLDMSGNMTAAGNVTAYSDIRLKENIEVIPNALEKVKQIRGVTFTRNDQDDKELRHTGVIAQEVEKVLPEVISEDNLGIKNVAYGNMVGLLIEAVKELKQEVDDLKAQLKEK